MLEVWWTVAKEIDQISKDLFIQLKLDAAHGKKQSRVSTFSTNTAKSQLVTLCYKISITRFITRWPFLHISN